MSKESKVILKNEGVIIINEETDKMKVSEYINVTHIGKTESGSQTKKLIALKDFQGNICAKWFNVDSISTISELKKKLLKMGYTLPTDSVARKLLLERLISKLPKRKVTIIERLGWYQAEDGDWSFVLSDKVIGNAKKIIVEPAGESNVYYPTSCNGSLKQWTNTISEACSHSTLMTLMFGVALSNALLRFYGKGGNRLYNLAGKTSLGKSTLEKILNALFRPKVAGKFASWHGTGTGREQICRNHSETVMILDEVETFRANKSGDPAKEISNFMYQFYEGGSKQRDAEYDKGRNNHSKIFTNIITSWETTFEEYCADKDIKRQDGIRVRIIDLPISSDSGYGIYDSIPEHISDPAAYSDMLAAFVEDNYGKAGYQYVSYLQKNQSKLSKLILKHTNDFLSSANIDSTQGENTRFANGFAIAYAALKLAVASGILKIDSKHVLNSVLEWHEKSNSLRNHEKQSEIEGLISFIEDLKSGKKLQNHTYKFGDGFQYLKTLYKGDTKVYAIPVKKLESYSKLNYRNLLGVSKSRGLIVADQQKKEDGEKKPSWTIQRTIQGKRLRCYAFKKDKLDVIYNAYKNKQ